MALSTLECLNGELPSREELGRERVQSYSICVWTLFSAGDFWGKEMKQRSLTNFSVLLLQGLPASPRGGKYRTHPLPTGITPTRTAMLERMLVPSSAFWPPEENPNLAALNKHPGSYSFDVPMCSSFRAGARHPPCVGTTDHLWRYTRGGWPQEQHCQMPYIHPRISSSQRPREVSCPFHREGNRGYITCPASQS